MLRLADWRDSGAEFAEVWHGLSRRWAERLRWDSSQTWVTIEAQRLSRALPGLVLLDGQRIAGWTFFIIHRGTLQVGGFETESAAATATLLDATLRIGERQAAPSGVMTFMFSHAPGVADALRQRGFDVAEYLYLTRELRSPTEPPPDPDWERSFIVQVPELLARSYGPATLTRPFARHDTLEEWREYVGQLIGTEACGRFDARLSAGRADADGRLCGTVLTTCIGPGSIHIAQVAVDPQSRGRGLAYEMIGDVFARAAAEQHTSASLLVEERNEQARRLYERLGFCETERFISAGRP